MVRHSKLNRLISLLLPLFILSVALIASGKPAEAGWSEPPYLLTVNVSTGGGMVKVNDELVTTLPKEYTYDSSTQVKLEAIPDAGYRFFRWSGTTVSENASITLNITCDTTMTAVFNPILPILTIEKHGGGTITPYVGQSTYKPGTVIKLKATPARGWKFDGWTSNVNDPNSPTTSVTLNADTKVAATFSWTVWLILVVVLGVIIVGGVISWLIYKYRKPIKRSLMRVLKS